MAVVHVEFPSIQRFVFRSRTLLDTVGRSAIINDLTSADFVRRWPGGSLGRVWAPGVGHFECEVTAGAPTDFVGWFTRQVADVSDVLRPVVVVADGDHGPSVSSELAGRLRAARHGTGAGMAGDGVWGAARCTVTGVDAAADEFTRRVNAAAARARTAEVTAAEDRGRAWHRSQQSDLIPAEFHNVFALPTDLDQLGRTVGESSKLGVVVADLNGVGAQLQTLAADTVALDAAATALEKVMAGICRFLVRKVIDAVDLSAGSATVGGFPESLQFTLGRAAGGADRGKWLLPIRPWVAAGDDVVVVCESRIAWSLGALIAQWLDAPVDDDTDPRAVLERLFGVRPTVAVGISVVPIGVSLSRAHGIAAVMCQSAKAAAKSELHHDRVPHAMEWHRGVIDPGAVADQRAQRGIALARPFVWSIPGPESFSTFLDDWLGADGPSLRGDWSHARSATRDRLLAAVSSARSVHQSADAHLAAELDDINSARTVFGRPALRLPPGGAGHFLDAIDLRDHHLHLGQHNATPTAVTAPTAQVAP